MTEEKRIIDDRRVQKNRKQVYLFVQLILVNTNDKTRRLNQKFRVVGNKIKTKVKRVSAYVVFGYTLISPTSVLVGGGVQNVLPFPNYGAAIHKIRQQIDEINEVNRQDLLSQVTILKELNVDKIVFTPQQYKQANKLFTQMRYGTLTMDDVVLQIRGGGWESILGTLFTIFILNDVWKRICESPEAAVFIDEAEAFLQQIQNQGKFPPKKGDFPPYFDAYSPEKTKRRNRIGIGPSQRISTALEVDKPANMPHQEFVSLTKEQRRALPHPNDMKIIREG